MWQPFFDRLDHQVTMSRVQQRVGDGRVLRLIEAVLKAGVYEAGVVTVPRQALRRVVSSPGASAT